MCLSCFANVDKAIVNFGKSSVDSLANAEAQTWHGVPLYIWAHNMRITLVQVNLIFLFSLLNKLVLALRGRRRGTGDI